MFPRKLATAALLSALLLHARPAHAYIDLAPTLAKLVSDSITVSVVEVTTFDRDKRTVTLKPVRALKGPTPVEEITHQLSNREGGAVPHQILEWAAGTGDNTRNRAVMFSSRTVSLVCLGASWYQVRNSAATTAPAAGNVWKLEKDRPDLPLCYYGSVSRLVEAIDAIVHQRLAVITVAAYSLSNQGAMFDLALNRQSLPGLMRVERICATASMPLTVASTLANPSYFVGPGRADASDIPALLRQLQNTDPNARADAADDLRTFGPDARESATELAALLSDANHRVRFAAAAALLCIAPAGNEVPALAAGLNQTDPVVRRLSAHYAGLSGDPAAPLVPRLTTLLHDPDDSVRFAALEAIATLGPVAGRADGAAIVNALSPLLDKTEWTINVADALGRVGSESAVARPALAGLAKLLASDQADVQWAAVRAMSQIGGPDAHPAVDFMRQAMDKASEVEGYNMMIYFALLGPVAEDAREKISTFQMKNPMLSKATLWAIAPEKQFPWNDPKGFGIGKDGDIFGPGPAGELFRQVLGGANPIEFVYGAYINGLGPRLAPAAKVLAQQLVDNTAGEVPAWGYHILAADPKTSVEILAPALKAEDPAARERAAVALGTMGTAATKAKDALTAAAQTAPTEREAKLLEWAAREVSQK